MPKPSKSSEGTRPCVIGIDLGTTNSASSYIVDGKPAIITSFSGKNTMPSIVNFAKSGEIVGDDARSLLSSSPSNTIFASKRLMGRKFADGDIKEYLKSLPYKTTESCNGDVWIKTDFGKFSPVQIGSKILGKIKKYSENFLGREVKKAVITVPAYFNDTQRQATRSAGKLAGLDVLRIINEPTAAALAYGLDKKESGHVAVYDLGGGTFDISILELSNGIFHVKSTNGDTFLGGEDFDEEIAKFIANMYEQKEEARLDRTPETMHRLKLVAENVKKTLSERDSAPVFVENIQDGTDFEFTMTRQQMESVIKRIANRTVLPCEQAIKDARIRKEDIKHVILVGGMTRMPYIRGLVKSIFNRPPHVDINPDEAVAHGAAIQGGILSGDIEGVLLLDVTPLSLGIEVLGGVFSKIVDRNTTIPFKQTERFSTSKDGQEEVDIKIYQGERGMVKDNMYLGEIKLKNIPHAPRGEPKIDVTFEADANGCIKVSAEDSATKMPQMVEITRAGGLGDDEIERLLKEAEENREKDENEAKKASFVIDGLRFVEEMNKIRLPKSVSERLQEFKDFISQKELSLFEGEERLKELKRSL